MATKKRRRPAGAAGGGGAADAAGISSPVEQLLLAALERGGDAFDTGRVLVTFKEGAETEAAASLGAQGMRVADARDFSGQAAALESAGDADAFVFPEIGVALVGGAAARERAMDVAAAGGPEGAAHLAEDSPFKAVEPEPFVFAAGDFGPLASGALFGQAAEGGGAGGGAGEGLRSAARILEAIAREVYGLRGPEPQLEVEESAAALGATWGLTACRVPPSTRSGAGIKVAVLDTGVDMGHPDFVGRLIAAQTQTFVGQPVQDLHSHGTHCIGTSC
ncbi:MAG TPA: S8 family serine peptidase, partial [Pyrinomonadaceae bacterium]|nr:S8 family serine peptidase [Pyrinomonadaceae bacterium]